MTRSILAALLWCSLAACAAPVEPINGCVLAAANRREVLRAQRCLSPALPARLLYCGFANAGRGHVALVYHLPEGWFVYDDACGSRRLPLATTTAASSLPAPMLAARAAFPGRPCCLAFYY